MNNSFKIKVEPKLLVWEKNDGLNVCSLKEAESYFEKCETGPLSK